jgi:DNA-binding transcriptional MocR family regulator
MWQQANREARCAACVPPPLEQLIACELLPQLAPLTGQRIRELRRQRDYLVNALREEGNWDFSVPQGGLWLWMRHARVSDDALAARASDEGLALLSGSRFPSTGHLATGCVSLSRRQCPLSAEG